MQCNDSCSPVCPLPGGEGQWKRAGGHMVNATACPLAAAAAAGCKKKNKRQYCFCCKCFFFCFSFFVLLSRSTVFPPFKIILAWKLKTCSLGNSIRVWTGGWQKHCHSFSYSFVHSLTLIFIYSLARCTANCLQKALLGDNFPIVVVVWIKKKMCSLIKKFHHFYWNYSPPQAAQN